MKFPDVNVWLAAVWSRHSKHIAAKNWFDAEIDDLAFCRVTQMSFLRLLSNPAVAGSDALTQTRAWDVEELAPVLFYDAGESEVHDMKWGSTALILIVLTAGALAQSAAGGQSNWDVLPAWGQLPAGANWGQPSQVATTPEGQIVVFRRMVPSFFVFNPDGTFVKSWGDVPYKLAHGIRIDKDGFIWITDNSDNFVQKFSADGKLLLTVGRKGAAGDNASQDAFDGPADVFVAPNGDFFVADGYRNSRVVQFSKEGKFIRIIGGTKGSEPGQFNLPHSVVLDSKGRVIVADAENSRIQVFDQTGKFLEQWTDFIAKPRGALYITPDDTLYVSHVDAEAISVVKNGKVVEVIRGVGGRPHGMTLDRAGNIYVTFPLTSGVKKIVRK